MVDIKRIFDRYNVNYRERGANVSGDNIVINCCFCAKTTNPDPSEHLAVHLPTGTFFCYRNSKHKGFVTRIFRYLGIPEYEYEDLKFKHEYREEEKVVKDFKLFRHFQSASESVECIDYLYKRGFSNPLEIIKRFALRFDLKGTWAGRLIIPLTEGWTGRSLRDHISPRYLTESSADGFFLCRNSSTSVILCEGPLDALRVASVTNEFDVIAKTTNRIKPAILNHLRSAGYLSIYNVPDFDVDFTLYFEEQKLLRSYCTSSVVTRLALPKGKKDFCDCSESETRAFLIGRGHAAGEAN